MKHNPRLNERVAALPGHARLHPAQDPKRAQGALELMWHLERALARSAACRTSACSRRPARTASSPACCSPAPTTTTAASSGTKVLTPDTAHGTNPATVTMAGYEVVKVATDERGGVDLDDLRAKADRRRRLPDADQPEHARPLRREHRRDRLDRPRGRRHPLLRRRQPERDHGPHPAGRHGLRHRPRQPAQVVQPAARRRRPRRRADRRLRADRAVPAGAADRPRRGARNGAGPSFDLDHDAPKSIGRLRGFQGNFGVFVRSYAYISQPRRRRPARGLGDRGPERQLPARRSCAQGRAGKYLPLAFERALHARVRPLRRAGEARARGEDARHRQAPARLRLPPADDLLPAARRRGADGRADRDRDARVARRARRRDRVDPRRGRGAIPRSCARRPTRRRSAASTRRRRAASRVASASRSRPASRPA